MGKFCLYADHCSKAPCMAIRMSKYSYLDDFISDNKHLKERAYSVPLNISCLKFDKVNQKYSINSPRCISCMFCVFGCIGNRILVEHLRPTQMCVDITKEQIESIQKELLPKLFQGNFLDLPQVPLSTLQVKYESFEDFTSIKETENIAVWGANAMKFLSSSLEPRVSLEVGLIMSERNRGGRLDISLFNTKDNYLFVAETKISFEAMMSEQRYESQLIAYESELQKTCSNKINYCKFLLIGGQESDLLPFNHKACSSGYQANLFYDIVRKNDFFFISANAMLALGLMKLYISQDTYNLENLFKIITNPQYIGILSSGVITRNGSVISFKQIPNFSDNSTTKLNQI